MDNFNVNEQERIDFSRLENSYAKFIRSNKFIDELNNVNDSYQKLISINNKEEYNINEVFTAYKNLINDSFQFSNLLPADFKNELALIRKQFPQNVDIDTSNDPIRKDIVFENAFSFLAISTFFDKINQSVEKYSGTLPKIDKTKLIFIDEKPLDEVIKLAKAQPNAIDDMTDDDLLMNIILTAYENDDSVTYYSVDDLINNKEPNDLFEDIPVSDDLIKNHHTHIQYGSIDLDKGNNFDEDEIDKFGYAKEEMESKLKINIQNYHAVIDEQFDFSVFNCDAEKEEEYIQNHKLNKKYYKQNRVEGLAFILMLADDDISIEDLVNPNALIKEKNEAGNKAVEIFNRVGPFSYVGKDVAAIVAKAFSRYNTLMDNHYKSLLNNKDNKSLSVDDFYKFDKFPYALLDRYMYECSDFLEHSRLGYENDELQKSCQNKIALGKDIYEMSKNISEASHGKAINAKKTALEAIELTYKVNNLDAVLKNDVENNRLEKDIIRPLVCNDNSAIYKIIKTGDIKIIDDFAKNQKNLDEFVNTVISSGMSNAVTCKKSENGEVEFGIKSLEGCNNHKNVDDRNLEKVTMPISKIDGKTISEFLSDTYKDIMIKAQTKKLADFIFLDGVPLGRYYHVADRSKANSDIKNIYEQLNEYDDFYNDTKYPDNKSYNKLKRLDVATAKFDFMNSFEGVGTFILAAAKLGKNIECAQFDESGKLVLKKINVDFDDEILSDFEQKIANSFQLKQTEKSDMSKENIDSLVANMGFDIDKKIAKDKSLYIKSLDGKVLHSQIKPSYNLSREAFEGLCFFGLICDGHSIEDIVKPNELVNEKNEMAKKIYKLLDENNKAELDKINIEASNRLDVVFANHMHELFSDSKSIIDLNSDAMIPYQLAAYYMFHNLDNIKHSFISNGKENEFIELNSRQINIIQMFESTKMCFDQIWKKNMIGDTKDIVSIVNSISVNANLKMLRNSLSNFNKVDVMQQQNSAGLLGEFSNMAMSERFQYNSNATYNWIYNKNVYSADITGPDTIDIKVWNPEIIYIDGVNPDDYLDMDGIFMSRVATLDLLGQDIPMADLIDQNKQIEAKKDSYDRSITAILDKNEEYDIKVMYNSMEKALDVLDNYFANVDLSNTKDLFDSKHNPYIYVADSISYLAHKLEKNPAAKQYFAEHDKEHGIERYEACLERTKVLADNIKTIPDIKFKLYSSVSEKSDIEPAVSEYMKLALVAAKIESKKALNKEVGVSKATNRYEIIRSENSANRSFEKLKIKTSTTKDAMFNIANIAIKGDEAGSIGIVSDETGDEWTFSIETNDKQFSQVVTVSDEKVDMESISEYAIEQIMPIIEKEYGDTGYGDTSKNPLYKISDFVLIDGEVLSDYIVKSFPEEVNSDSNQGGFIDNYKEKSPKWISNVIFSALAKNKKVEFFKLDNDKLLDKNPIEIHLDKNVFDKVNENALEKFANRHRLSSQESYYIDDLEKNHREKTINQMSKLAASKSLTFVECNTKFFEDYLKTHEALPVGRDYFPMITMCYLASISDKNEDKFDLNDIFIDGKIEDKKKLAGRKVLELYENKDYDKIAEILYSGMKRFHDRAITNINKTGIKDINVYTEKPGIYDFYCANVVFGASQIYAREDVYKSRFLKLYAQDRNLGGEAGLTEKELQTRFSEEFVDDAVVWSTMIKKHFRGIVNAYEILHNNTNDRSNVTNVMIVNSLYNEEINSALNNTEVPFNIRNIQVAVDSKISAIENDIEEYEFIPNEYSEIKAAAHLQNTIANDKKFSNSIANMILDENYSTDIKVTKHKKTVYEADDQVEKTYYTFDYSNIANSEFINQQDEYKLLYGVDANPITEAKKAMVAPKNDNETENIVQSLSLGTNTIANLYKANKVTIDGKKGKFYFADKVNIIDEYNAINAKYQKKYPLYKDLFSKISAHFDDIDLMGKLMAMPYETDDRQLKWKFTFSNFDVNLTDSMYNNPEFADMMTNYVKDNAAIIEYQRKSAFRNGNAEQTLTQIEAYRNVAKMFDMDSLVANYSKYTYDDSGVKKKGILVEDVNGIDFNELTEESAQLFKNGANQINEKPQLIRDLANMQVLDYLLGNEALLLADNTFVFKDNKIDSIVKNSVEFAFSDESKTEALYDDIKKFMVVGKEFADKLMNTKVEDIVRASNSTDFSDKQIICMNRRLNHLKSAIKNKEIAVVEDNAWRNYTLDKLSKNQNLFALYADIEAEATEKVANNEKVVKENAKILYRDEFTNRLSKLTDLKNALNDADPRSVWSSSEFKAVKRTLDDVIETTKQCVGKQVDKNIRKLYTDKIEKLNTACQNYFAIKDVAKVNRKGGIGLRRYNVVSDINTFAKVANDQILLEFYDTQASKSDRKQEIVNSLKSMFEIKRDLSEKSWLNGNEHTKSFWQSIDRTLDMAKDMAIEIFDKGLNYGNFEEYKAICLYMQSEFKNINDDKLSNMGDFERIFFEETKDKLTALSSKIIGHVFDKESPYIITNDTLTLNFDGNITNKNNAINEMDSKINNLVDKSMFVLYERKNKLGSKEVALFNKENYVMIDGTPLIELVNKYEEAHKDTEYDISTVINRMILGACVLGKQVRMYDVDDDGTLKTTYKNLEVNTRNIDRTFMQKYLEDVDFDRILPKQKDVDKAVKDNFVKLINTNNHMKLNAVLSRNAFLQSDIPNVKNGFIEIKQRAEIPSMVILLMLADGKNLSDIVEVNKLVDEKKQYGERFTQFLSSDNPDTAAMTDLVFKGLEALYNDLSNRQLDFSQKNILNKDSICILTGANIVLELQNELYRMFKNVKEDDIEKQNYKQHFERLDNATKTANCLKSVIQNRFNSMQETAKINISECIELAYNEQFLKNQMSKNNMSWIDAANIETENLYMDPSVRLMADKYSKNIQLMKAYVDNPENYTAFMNKDVSESIKVADVKDGSLFVRLEGTKLTSHTGVSDVEFGNIGGNLDVVDVCKLLNDGKNLKSILDGDQIEPDIKQARSDVDELLRLRKFDEISKLLINNITKLVHSDMADDEQVNQYINDFSERIKFYASDDQKTKIIGKNLKDKSYYYKYVMLAANGGVDMNDLLNDNLNPDAYNKMGAEYVDCMMKSDRDWFAKNLFVGTRALLDHAMDILDSSGNYLNKLDVVKDNPELLKIYDIVSNVKLSSYKKEYEKLFDVDDISKAKDFTEISDTLEKFNFIFGKVKSAFDNDKINAAKTDKDIALAKEQKAKNIIVGQNNLVELSATKGNSYYVKFKNLDVKEIRNQDNAYVKFYEDAKFDEQFSDSVIGSFENGDGTGEQFLIAIDNYNDNMAKITRVLDISAKLQLPDEFNDLTTKLSWLMSNDIKSFALTDKGTDISQNMAEIYDSIVGLCDKLYDYVDGLNELNIKSDLKLSDTQKQALKQDLQNSKVEFENAISDISDYCQNKFEKLYNKESYLDLDKNKRILVLKENIEDALKPVKENEVLSNNERIKELISTVDDTIGLMNYHIKKEDYNKVVDGLAKLKEVGRTYKRYFRQSNSNHLLDTFANKEDSYEKLNDLCNVLSVTSDTIEGIRYYDINQLDLRDDENYKPYMLTDRFTSEHDKLMFVDYQMAPIFNMLYEGVEYAELRDLITIDGCTIRECQNAAADTTKMKNAEAVINKEKSDKLENMFEKNIDAKLKKHIEDFETIDIKPDVISLYEKQSKNEAYELFENREYNSRSMEDDLIENSQMTILKNMVYYAAATGKKINFFKKDQEGIKPIEYSINFAEGQNDKITLIEAKNIGMIKENKVLPDDKVNKYSQKKVELTDNKKYGNMLGLYKLPEGEKNSILVQFEGKEKNFVEKYLKDKSFSSLVFVNGLNSIEKKNNFENEHCIELCTNRYYSNIDEKKIVDQIVSSFNEKFFKEYTYGSSDVDNKEQIGALSKDEYLKKYKKQITEIEDYVATLDKAEIIKAYDTIMNGVNKDLSFESFNLKKGIDKKMFNYAVALDAMSTLMPSLVRTADNDNDKEMFSNYTAKINNVKHLVDAFVKNSEEQLEFSYMKKMDDTMYQEVLDKKVDFIKNSIEVKYYNDEFTKLKQEKPDMSITDAAERINANSLNLSAKLSTQSNLDLIKLVANREKRFGLFHKNIMANGISTNVSILGDKENFKFGFISHDKIVSEVPKKSKGKNNPEKAPEEVAKKDTVKKNASKTII